jgi:hypothetical protein
VTALLRLSRLIDSITELIGKFAMWLILAAVLISAGNAIMRKAFDMGSNAFLEIQWYLFAAVFMLASGYVFLRNAHVRIDFISNKLSQAHQRHHRCHRHRGLRDPAVPDPRHAVLAGVRAQLGFRRNEPERRRPDPLAGAVADPGGLRHPVHAVAVSELIKRIAFVRGDLEQPFSQDPNAKPPDLELAEALAAKVAEREQQAGAR